MHPQALVWVLHAARVYGPFERGLDVGGLNINGSARYGFPPGSIGEWVSTDIRPGRDVDVVAAGQALPFGQVFDIVCCCEVFEHIAYWPRLLAAFITVVRPGGIVVVTCASDGRAEHSGIDGGELREGEWYRNIKLWELVLVASAAGFDVEEQSYLPEEGDARVILRRPSVPALPVGE